MGEPISAVNNSLRMRNPAPASQPASQPAKPIDLRLPAKVEDEYIPPSSSGEKSSNGAVRKAYQKKAWNPFPEVEVGVDMSDGPNKKFDPQNLDHKPRVKIALKWYLPDITHLIRKKK